jgi:SNF2 family DNA or RNA helicase
MIILDEATVIKNPKSKRTERLLYAFNDIVRRGRTIMGSYPKTIARAILTGTPVTESPFDLWSMFEFLQPNFFHCNYYAFCRKHGLFQELEVEGRRISILLSEETWIKCKHLPYEEAASLFGITLRTYDIIQQQQRWEGPYIGMEEIKQQIDTQASWCRIADIADMPERVYNRKFLDMDEEQMKVYKSMEQKFIAFYKDKTVDAKAKVTVKLRLQQIASGFITSVASIPEDATDEEVIEFLNDPPPREVTWFDKKPKVEQLFHDLEELGSERVVILTRFTAEAAMLYDQLVLKGYKVNMQTGWKKVGTIESFKEGKEQIMVANIRVVSKGFNFQAGCNHLMYYSNTFSLEDRIQSEARIYRTGQSKTCIYYDYMMRGTVDESIKARLEMKQGISDFFWDKHLEEIPDIVKGDEDLPVF